MKTTILAATISIFGASAALSQEADKKPSLNDLDFLIGEWSLETNYANGAQANGTRRCVFALRNTRIRCTTESLFADGSARDLVTYYSYNAQADRFDEMTVFQRPIGNKVADFHLNLATGQGMSRGYVYGGDGTSGPRVSEEWRITENSISTEMRLNRSGQPAHEWAVFIEEKMTRLP